MARLIYSPNTSLDGFTEDAEGSFDWAAPDEELHGFINDRLRPAGTHLYGSAMYETMKVWETMDDPEPVMRDFAQLWRAADKIVYSSSLTEVETERTRLEREFDPATVRALKEEAGADLLIGGPTLAVAAFAAGLVDEVHLYVHPVSVGGGKPALPREQRHRLELRDQRRFANGVVFSHYDVP